MAYLVTGAAGLSFVASTSSAEEKKYSPVYGELLDVSFLWDELPDFYRKYLQGSEYMTSVWGGVAQVLAADLLHLYETDYAKSLRDIPYVTQRKWLTVNQDQLHDFATSPGFSSHGFSDFSYVTPQVTAGFTVRSGIASRYYKKLDGTVAQEGSLTWYVDLTVTTSEDGSIALAGYSKHDAVGLESTLACGLLSTAGGLYTALVHGRNLTSAAATAVGAVSLSTGTKYRIKTEYTSSTSNLVATATELRATRTTSTSGYTEGTAGELTTTLNDASKDFVTAGVVVGDILVFDGFDHVITSVSTTILVVEFATLPADATAMSYTIVGEKQIDSVALNLLTESDRSFSADSFGLISGESYLLRDLAAVPRRTIAATVHEIFYTDPSLGVTIVDLPRLQNTPLSPTTTKHIGQDYLLKENQVAFLSPTTGDWHGEFGLFDESRVYNNFGANVPLTQETASEDYLNRVRGLHYALYRGPTMSSIKTGVLASVGLPLAIESGKVTQINTTYSGERGQIVVSGRSYLYPLSVGTSLSVGDDVAQFAPLCDGVEVKDYINTPTWFDDFGFITEIQKYHTFAVDIDLDAFDASSLTAAAAISQARTTLDLMKPTQKDFLLVGSRALEDSESVDDAIVLAPTLIVADALSEPYPVYDDRRFYGPAYDWAYDQGQTAWEAIPGSVAYFAYQNTETKPWNGTASQSQFLTGGTVEIVEGEPEIQDGAGEFISELGRVCSAFSTGGSTSGTIFTGNANERFLTSIPNSSLTLPAGMVIRVVVSNGSSVHSVLTATAILNNTQLTLSASTSSLSGLTYEVRVSGPVGTVHVQDLLGAGSTSGTGFTATGSPGFLSSIPNTGGVPDRPTFVFAQPYNAAEPDKYLRQVATVTGNTTLTVSSAFGTPNLSSKNYVVFTPRTAIAASPGVDSTAGTTTTNTFVATSSTSMFSSTSGVVDSVGLKDVSHAFNVSGDGNVSGGFGLAITAPSGSLVRTYEITGLFASGSNYIKTAPAFTATGTSVNYEVFRGAFQDVAAGDLLVVATGANAGTYTITGVSSSGGAKGRDTVTISGAFPAATSTTAYVYRVASLWARVAHVYYDSVSATSRVYTTSSWPGAGKTSASDSGGGTGSNEVVYDTEKAFSYLSEVDLGALEAFYDHASELSPDERVVLEWTPTPGYGGEPLRTSAGPFIFTTDGTNKNQLNHANSLTSTVPSVGDVVILPSGRARIVTGYTSGALVLANATAARADSGADFTNVSVYLIDSGEVTTAATSFEFANGNATVTVTGGLSGKGLTGGELIQPILPGTGADNTTDLPVVRVSGSYGGSGNITQTSPYTGDDVTTTQIVVRSTASLYAGLGGYNNLTDDDFHNVEVPGSAQTVAHVVPENTFL